MEGDGRNVAIVARPRSSAGCIIVHAIVIAIVVIVRPHPHDFYVQIPDPAGADDVLRGGRPSLPARNANVRSHAMVGGRASELLLSSPLSSLSILFGFVHFVSYCSHCAA